jgi:glucose-1-phosphate adenylyltransferase
VIVESGALVEDSVLMNDVVIGPGAVVRRAILDKNVKVEAGAVLGVDPTSPSRRFTVSERKASSSSARASRSVVIGR